MKVVWTPKAESQLGAIFQYLEPNSATYARRLMFRLIDLADEFADVGRMILECGVETSRELIDPPYRLMYRILPNQIDILAVIHAAREFNLEMVGG